MNSSAPPAEVQSSPRASNLPLSVQLAGLASWFAICFAAAAIGTAASVNAPTFYRQLVRPAWAPPAWLFGPVWTVLYTLMAIAAWLVWRRGGVRANHIPLLLFLAQLALNALWSWLFFAWQLGAVSVIEIALLNFLIVATIIVFWRHDRLAAVLLLPYFAWVSFAAVLNTNLWLVNTQIL